MPSESPRPPRRSWRDDKKPAAQRAGHRAWQKDKDAAKQAVPLKWSRQTKLVLAGASLLGVVIALVLVVILFRPPAPARFILVGCSYEANLAVPHNVAGTKALDGMAQLEKGGDSS